MKRSRKIAFILTAALLLQLLPLEGLAAVWDAAGISRTVQAADDGVSSGNDGNIHWEYTDDTRTLTLTPVGGESVTMPQYNYGDNGYPYDRTSAPWNCHALDTYRLVVGSGIENISEYAFYGFDYLKSVTMEGVTEISARAFSDRPGLQTVSMPKVESIGDSAFSGCTSLTGKIELGNVTAIGQSAFSNCKNLTSVDIPKVETIGNSAFSGCTSLTGKIDLGNVTEIGDSAFFNCNNLNEFGGDSGSAVIPSQKVEKIGATAFYGCGKLTSVTIGEGVTTIGDSAFASSGLTDIKFPESVKSVGTGILKGTKLTDVSWPKNVPKISESAFEGCNSLEKITVPDWVTGIGKKAFFNCTNLAEVIIADDANGGDGSGRKAIGEEAFSGCAKLTQIDLGKVLKSIGKSAFNGTGMTKFTVPASVDEIGINPWVGGELEEFEVDSDNQRYAVDNGMLVEKKDETYTVISYPCKGKNEPTVSGWVREIQESAFQKTKITKVKLSEGLETIGKHAFYQSSIENVQTPTSLRTIGYEAFAEMNQLQEVKLSEGLKTIGERAFYNSPQRVTIPSSIQTMGRYAFASEKQQTSRLQGVELSEGLETIGEYAFYNSALESVTIPGSIRTMGRYAFAGMYQGQSKLRSVELSEGLGKISEYAFYNSALESIKTPASLRTIGDNAFAYTNKLQDAELSEGLETIGEYAFYNSALESVTIPGSIRTMGGYAFASMYQGQSKLRSVELSEGLGTISEYAFYNSALESIKTPASLRTIGNNAFANTNKLQGAELSEGLESMGTYAFYRSALESVKLPKSLEEISDNAFAYTNSLKDIKFSEGLKVIKSYAFAGAAALEQVDLPGSLVTIEYGAFSGDTALVTINAEGGHMTAIGASAFSGCTKLQNVLLGGELLDIGSSAFNECKSIKEIALPDKMKTLGDNVFSGCTGLETIDFPNSITKVGKGALSGCTALKRATFGTVIQEISGDVFENCPSITEITVSVRNPYMMAEDNIIYSKSKKKLIYYAAGLPDEKFSVPEGIEVIGSKSFTYCAHLEEIRFPASVKSLEKEAVFLNKKIGKLFFLGDGPECSVKEELSKRETSSSEGNTIYHYTYKQYNDSIVKDRAVINVYARQGTSGWGKGWTEKTKEDTFSGNKDLKYEWEYRNCDFNDKDWDPTKTDVSNGVYGGLSWKYRDDVGELTFSGKGKIPDFAEDDLPTWTDEDDTSESHMKDIRVVKTDGADEIEIGNNAFRGASRLHTILAGDHLTRIGEGAFANCTGLVSVDVYCVKQIEKEAFQGDTSIVDDLDARNAEFLGEGAFKGCSAMKGLLLGEKLKSIGSAAFQSCSDLDTMIVPESVTSIGENCFKGCETLRSINIPKGIRNIPAGSFAECSNLQKVYFYGDYPDTWAEDSFTGWNEDLKLCYRAGNETWGSAGSDWNDIPLMALDKFYKVGKDAYSFVDSREAFGYDKDYIIPFQRYATALQSINLGMYYQELDKFWRGSCFGMASSTMELYEGKLYKASDFNESAKNVYGLSAPGSYKAKLTKMIEIYQVSQHADKIGQELYKNFGKYRSLMGQVEEFERSGGLSVDAYADPVIICVYTDYSGHALIPAAVNMDKEGNYILDVYDCRYPGALQKMKIKKDFSGIEYNGYDTASFVRYSTVCEVLKEADFTGQNLKWKTSDSNRVHLAVNQKDVSIVNGGGRDHTEIKGAYEQHLVAAGEESKDAFGGIRSFVLPLNDYKVQAENVEGELKYYAATNNFFAEAATSDKDAQLTVHGFKGEDGDKIEVSSEHPETKTDLTIVDKNGIKKEISLTGSDITIVMNKNKGMTMEVSEDAADVMVDGKAVKLPPDRKASISFYASEDENPLSIRDMSCDISLDKDGVLSGTAEACAVWAKEAADKVGVGFKVKGEKGNVIAEYETTTDLTVGAQQINLEMNNVKSELGDLSGEFGAVCEMTLTDQKGNTATATCSDVTLAAGEIASPVPTAAPTPVPTAKPTPMPTVKPTTKPTSVPTPAPAQKPTDTPVLSGTPVPVTTAAPAESPAHASGFLAKGTWIYSKKAGYKISKTGKQGREVTYMKPLKQSVAAVTIANTVKVNGVRYKVTAIAPNAFKNCKKLKRITIGKNIASIGAKAFYKCTRLAKIEVKTKNLSGKRVGSRAFEGIYKKAVAHLPKNKRKAYEKLLRARGLGKKVKFKTSR